MLRLLPRRWWCSLARREPVMEHWTLDLSRRLGLEVGVQEEEEQKKKRS